MKSDGQAFFILKNAIPACPPFSIGLSMCYLMAKISAIHSSQKESLMENQLPRLAEYTEKAGLMETRTFELYPGHVLVKQRAVLGNCGLFHVSLDSLSVHSNKVWIRDGFRDQIFIYAGLILFLCLLYDISKKAIHVANIPFGFSLPAYILMIAVLSLAGIALFVACFGRRNEYHYFTNKEGITVLSIGKVGPDVAKFEEFVGMLEKQIRARKT